MTIRDLLASFVRTLVPTVVGLVLAWLATANIDIDSQALTVVIDGVFIGGYYALVRLLEQKFPWLGVLLGWKMQPTYETQAVRRG